MATVDSGNETLFSDDSPCDLTRSPTAYSADDSEVTECHLRIRNRPPNIQPYSGVLEKGRVVIRPIAFRPTGMSPAARFGLDGERYGSTPILTRSGSNDHRHHMIPNSNYSLDRKLRSSCQSATTSPPLPMSSLTSLPHKLINYDSLESIRKSPVSTADSTLTNKSSYRLSGEGGGSLLDLTPSPSDSGVSELEAALRDRDSELAYLRQTMEHNEQVIFRVYQEKEKVWERELRRLKTLHENRLRTSAQKALKLEQLLMMQTYQLQEDKKRLYGEVQKANGESERVRQEVGILRSRLEETEWSLCQKTGEISLLKSQLKDYQSDQTAKGHELLQLRNDYREVREQLDRRDYEIDDIRKEVNYRDVEIERLKNEIKKLVSNMNDTDPPSINYYISADYLSNEIRDAELNNSSLSDDKCIITQIERIRQINLKNTDEVYGSTGDCSATLNGNCLKVYKLKEEMEIKKKEFEKERLVWAQEKEKVLKYQRQLQMNYIQMYRRTKALEAEVETLTIELELDKTGITKKLPNAEITHTIEL